ncbi:MAG: FkbM family methyltransferase, partial [Marinirhabdus sp.]|nr:FkbM family methyltransferase [Marinirhabdus sp.]
SWCNEKASSRMLLTRLLVRTVENILCISSFILSHFKKIQFPKRTLGSRFWIYQWRVEFLMEWWEYETTPWVRKFVKPGMTVLDIGAHIGYYTDLFSRLVQSHGKVYAFEASPENYPILINNLAARRRTNVVAHHRALSDQNGVLNLYVSPGHSNHSLVEGYTEAEETVPVQAVRLDDFLPGEKIDFLKMDVEGSEPRVLEGMRKIIQASEDLIMLVEYNYVALGNAYSSPQVLLDLLTELGYQYKAILDDGSLGDIPIEKENLKLSLNLLCTRKAAR